MDTDELPVGHITADEVALIRTGLHQELDAVRAKNATLREQVEAQSKELRLLRSVDGLHAAARLFSNSIESGQWEVKADLRVPNFHKWLSRQVINLMEAAQAENNLTWTCGRYGEDEFTIEITRGGRPTPATQRDAARAECERLENELRQLRAVSAWDDGDCRRHHGVDPLESE